MTNGLLGSNKEASYTNPRLALSRIMGGLRISDETAATTTHRKLIPLSARNIPQTASAMNKNAIRKTYPSKKQYLASPGTKEGRMYFGHIRAAATRRGQLWNNWKGGPNGN